MDPCAPVKRHWRTAKKHYTISDDGLKQEWSGRVWLNPPFTRYERSKWMEKMSKHNNGIMLIPAACETKDFAKYVWGKCAGMLMMKYRPHFYDVNGKRDIANSGCTIVLIAYGKNNFKILKKSGLGFPLIEA